MKNNRKVEVGQVRELVGIDEPVLYHIKSVSALNMEVLLLTGENKGSILNWAIDFADEDIVVM